MYHDEPLRHIRNIVKLLAPSNNDAHPTPMHVVCRHMNPSQRNIMINSMGNAIYMLVQGSSPWKRRPPSSYILPPHNGPMCGWSGSNHLLAPSVVDEADKEECEVEEFVTRRLGKLDDNLLKWVLGTRYGWVEHLRCLGTDGSYSYNCIPHSAYRLWDQGLDDKQRFTLDGKRGGVVDPRTTLLPLVPRRASQCRRETVVAHLPI